MSYCLEDLRVLNARPQEIAIILVYQRINSEMAFATPLSSFVPVI